MNGRKVNISGNELIRRFEFGLRDHKGGHILSKNFESLNFFVYKRDRWKREIG